MPTTQMGSLTPKGEILQNNRLCGSWAASTALSAPSGLGFPHADPTPRHLIQTPRADDINDASHPARESRYSNRYRSPTLVERQISVSAQRRVKQTGWIELCSNATRFVVCGAGAGSKVGGCFRLLPHHPRHLVLLAHVEHVVMGGFGLAHRNLQPNPMVLVCLVADFFLNDEG